MGDDITRTYDDVLQSSRKGCIIKYTLTFATARCRPRQSGLFPSLYKHSSISDIVEAERTSWTGL